MSTTYTLNTYTLFIETHGICTHFTSGVINGVPPRVVLPYTTHIQAGTVAIQSLQPAGTSPDPLLYYLIPHFAQFEIAGFDLTIPHLLQNGDVLNGVRLQVINCIDQGVTYNVREYSCPNLATYYPGYTISSDVVLHGRAACYFDIYGGTVTYIAPLGPHSAGFVQIEMQTVGQPELLVTPLAQAGGMAYRVKLPTPDDGTTTIVLKVKNAELMHERRADAELGAFDFMLHYLTAQGGIPETLAYPTPGMPKNPHGVKRERMAGALRELADMLATAYDPAIARRHLTSDFTASCAPSEYP